MISAASFLQDADIDFIVFSSPPLFSVIASQLTLFLRQPPATLHYIFRHTYDGL